MNASAAIRKISLSVRDCFPCSGSTFSCLCAFDAYGTLSPLGHGRTDSIARGRTVRTPDGILSRSGTPDSVEKARALDSARALEEGVAHGASESLDDISGVQRRSEKARGKMKERSPEDEMDESLERIAAAGVGRNGFVPTQDWVASWQTG